MPHLTAIISCVNYGDFLSWTLPTAVRIADRVVVVTDHEDTRTRGVASDHAVEMVRTSAWYRDDAPFNKGAAIHTAIEATDKIDWLLLLDADIYLPPPPRPLMQMDLDEDVMYSVRRRDCPTRDALECLRRAVDISTLEQMPEPWVRKGRVWGRRPTGNPCGVLGYFQLWRFAKFPHMPSMVRRTAAKYDVELALKFPDHNRRYLDYEVVHLGERRVNWKGRKTPMWDAG